MFLKTIAEADAIGPVAAIYAQDRARFGIPRAHIDRLRAAGFSDPQICDIALCASLRCFMSHFYDATGAAPESFFLDADARVRSALTVGRALA